MQEKKRGKDVGRLSQGYFFDKKKKEKIRSSLSSRLLAFYYKNYEKIEREVHN